MIRVSDLTVRLGAFSLQRVSFEIPRGQYAVLMGRTGSGKTTLLEALCGLRPVCAGRIWLSDREVTSLSPSARGIGYVPQEGALFAHLSVRQHLSFALEIRRRPWREIEPRVDELARLLNLEHLLDRTPHGLSGGETQRVALGRALSFAPPVLLLDEPMSALDEESRSQAYEVLRRVQRQTGVTVLHITHNPEESRQLADRELRLSAGKIEESSSNAIEEPQPISHFSRG